MDRADMTTTRETADHAELARLAEDKANAHIRNLRLAASRDFAVSGYSDGLIVEQDMRGMLLAAAEAFDALLSEIAALRASMEWVAQVQPSNLPWSGAQVEITWDEFNAMRSALGLRVTKPGKPNGHSYNWKKRATQAERQRDELRNEAVYLLAHVQAATSAIHDPEYKAAGYRHQVAPMSNATHDRIRAFIANQGADQ